MIHSKSLLEIALLVTLWQYSGYFALQAMGLSHSNTNQKIFLVIVFAFNKYIFIGDDLCFFRLHCMKIKIKKEEQM